MRAGHLSHSLFLALSLARSLSFSHTGVSAHRNLGPVARWGVGGLPGLGLQSGCRPEQRGKCVFCREKSVFIVLFIAYRPEISTRGRAGVGGAAWVRQAGDVTI